MFKCRDCGKTFYEPDIELEMWTDSGVYPSGGGGYALPSYEYEADVCPHCGSEDILDFQEED
jgi:DNA-directed RNA polymerase subunit RPC12/RpoP